MSYPPNSLDVVRRDPQHGIRVAGGTTSNLLSRGSSSSHSCALSPMKARTVICAEPDCNNRFAVVPHGFHAGLGGIDSAIHINARCRKCEPPAIVPGRWEGYEKSEEGSETCKESSDWADEF